MNPLKILRISGREIDVSTPGACGRGWQYEGNGRLTLNGCGSEQAPELSLYAQGDLTLVLKTYTGNFFYLEGRQFCAAAILVKGNLLIEGPGSLHAAAEKDHCNAIRVDGTLTLTNSVHLFAKGDFGVLAYAGLHAENSKLDVRAAENTALFCGGGLLLSDSIATVGGSSRCTSPITVIGDARFTGSTRLTFNTDYLYGVTSYGSIALEGQTKVVSKMPGYGTVFSVGGGTVRLGDEVQIKGNRTRVFVSQKDYRHCREAGQFFCGTQRMDRGDYNAVEIPDGKNEMREE